MHPSGMQQIFVLNGGLMSAKLQPKNMKDRNIN
jgi:hypothetical protein